MLPQVPKVVLVQESLAGSEAQVGEPDLGRVIRKPHTPRLRDTVSLATDDKLVQVITFPAHGNLERIMPVGNGTVAADEESPPDHGTDLAQPDVELVDVGKRCDCPHALRA
jgi:hypothetical protein